MRCYHRCQPLPPQDPSPPTEPLGQQSDLAIHLEAWDFNIANTRHLGFASRVCINPKHLLEGVSRASSRVKATELFPTRCH
jgi:hypothetical protein